MPYKTKFREVKFPESREDWKSISYDANSLRSLGAAFYKELAGRHNVNMDTFQELELVVGSAMDLANTAVLISRKDLLYCLQGIQRAAKVSPIRCELNELVKKYISKQIENIQAEIKFEGIEN